MIKPQPNVGWISGSASTKPSFFPASVDALALIPPTSKPLPMSEPRNGSNSDSTVSNPGVVMDVKEANAKYLPAAEREIPEGYKQTEVGVIPEDWEVSSLENVARVIDPQPDHRTPPETVGGEPYIGISDFNNDKTVNWDASRKIILKAVDKQHSSFQMHSGDIIFGKIGTIGQPKFVPTVPFR